MTGWQTKVLQGIQGVKRGLCFHKYTNFIIIVMTNDNIPLHSSVLCKWNKSDSSHACIQLVAHMGRTQVMCIYVIIPLLVLYVEVKTAFIQVHVHRHKNVYIQV